MTQRSHSREDPYADEDFESLDSDRSYVVTTPDGVPLAVREVGPPDARVDHGLRARILSADGRLPLSARRGSPRTGDRGVRMVFYDQRGHGRSGEAAPETYTLTQLGEDLESVLQSGRAARGDRVGRPFDGRHDGVVARQAVPRAVRAPDRRCGADLLGRRRGYPIATGRDPEKPCGGSFPVHRSVGPEADAPRPQRVAVADRARFCGPPPSATCRSAAAWTRSRSG